MFFKKLVGLKDKPKPETEKPPSSTDKPTKTIKTQPQPLPPKQKIERPQTTVQNQPKPNSPKIPIPLQREETFEDLMRDVDGEGNPDEVFRRLSESQNRSKTRLLANSHVTSHRNRIGTVIPQSFLGEMMNLREQEIDNLDHESYFEVQRSLQDKDDSRSSQKDFMDSFFSTSKGEPEEEKKQQASIIKSVPSHNSFEIVDDHNSLMTHISDDKKANSKMIDTLNQGTSSSGLGLIRQELGNIRKDILITNKQELILQKQSTPTNDTTNSSEIVKSDQLGSQSQKSSSPQSTQKQISGSSNSGSNMNSAELSSSNSSELIEKTWVRSASQAEFENRPTAQFVKNQDFIVESQQQEIIFTEDIDFVPKIFIGSTAQTTQIKSNNTEPNNIYDAWKSQTLVTEKPETNKVEILLDLSKSKNEKIQESKQTEQTLYPTSIPHQNPDPVQIQKQQQNQFQEQEQIFQVIDSLQQQPEIGFEQIIIEEVDVTINGHQEFSLNSMLASFDQNGLPTETYFDRKRIQETSVNEGAYYEAPQPIQRRVALPKTTKVVNKEELLDNVVNVEQKKPRNETQVKTKRPSIVDQVVQLEQKSSSVLIQDVAKQQHQVSTMLPVDTTDTKTDDRQGFVEQMLSTDVRLAFRVPKKDKTQLLLEQMRQVEQLALKEQNSSESELTDESFIECCSLNSEEIELSLQVHEQRLALENAGFLNDLTHHQDNFEFKQDKQNEVKLEDEQEDILKVISENEIAYKVHNDLKYQDLRNKNVQFPKTADDSLQKVVSDPESIPGGVNKLLGPNEKKTCICVQEFLILIGTNQGVLHAFNKETGILLGTHQINDKDFTQNAITCIDVHQLRNKYAVIGFQRGQIALIDLTEIKKTVKLIKDHHKKPIVSVKFCDWAKEKPHYSMGKDHKCSDCADVKAWMFVSIDTDSKVVVNTVTNIAFGALYANDFVINDPFKTPEHLRFEGISAAFSSRSYPTDTQTENATVVALACSECVVIRVLGDKMQEQRMFVRKPTYYASENLGGFQENKVKLPCLAWGYGKTPTFNFQVFPLLAIAWGPIIQIVVFREIGGDNSQGEDFQQDGYYIISQSSLINTNQDLIIRSLHFIDESLLIAVTSSGELRIMCTEKFKESLYTDQRSITSLETLDPRCKYLINGTPLSSKQSDIERERVTRLTINIDNSMYGISTAQVCSVWQDKFYFIGSDQRVYSLKHMNWLENLLVVNQIAKEGAWIEVFVRALNIYTGKLRGLRIEGETEQAKKEKMRSQLKTFIETLVSQTIAQFRTQKSQSKEVVADNCALLIRVVIEFSIEIGEPIFLFEALQAQFKHAGLSSQFSAEIKPYLLSGTFSECIIPEKILEEGILLNFKKLLQETHEENLAENFEKILLNLRFDSCSKKYLDQLIVLCNENNFSTGVIHISLYRYGDQGPAYALFELRNFYLDGVAFENENKESFKSITLEEIYQVNLLSQTSTDRVRIEQSSMYVGLKLLWTTRFFLLGKKVPRGIFTNNQWNILCHDVLDLVTQPEIIGLFVQIDAAAYFQILSIVFNNPSFQYTSIEKGRPSQKGPYQPLPIGQQQNPPVPPVITHETIIQRIQSHFQEQNISKSIENETSQVRLYYLCFIASICGKYQQSSDDLKNGQMYFEVALELMRHSEQLLSFNKNALSRRMTNKLMYRRLSTAGNVLPDDQKHLIVSEEMLLMLVERARPELADQKKLDQMLEAVEKTDFTDVKLVLHDLNHDYSKAIRLFMRNSERQKPTLSVKTSKGEIDGFEWIQNRYTGLDARAHEDAIAMQQLQNFRREIFSHAFYLVKVNTVKTIQLCDAILKSAHLDIIECMQGEQQWQLVYIQILVEQKREEIKKLISGHTPGAKKAGDFDKWKSILNLHIRLLCILEPSRVVPEIDKIVKDNFYPMEECLKTCFEFKQIEACALINKKLGNYSEAIQLYLKVMANGLNIEILKKELFHYNQDRQKHIAREKQRLTELNQARMSQDMRQVTDMKLVQLLIQNAVKTVVQITKNDKLQNHYAAWVSKFGKNLELLDRVTDRIQNICRNHPKEVVDTKENEVCMNVLQALFTILFHPSIRRKTYCKRYLKMKIVSFCRSILEYISFKRLLQVATANNKNLKYKAIKELIYEVFCDKTQEIEMCMTVESNSQSDLRFFQNLIIKDKGTGLSFTSDSLTCGICKQSVSGQKFKSQLVLHSKSDDLVIFDCKNAKQERHACHARCIKKMIQDGQQNEHKKAQLSEKALIKLYRCPSCNPKNQSILSVNEQKSEETIQVSGPTSTTIDPVIDDQEVVQATSSRRTLRLQPTTAEQKMAQKLKNLRKLDETLMMDECLTRGDFRLD